MSNVDLNKITILHLSDIHYNRTENCYRYSEKNLHGYPPAGQVPDPEKAINAALEDSSISKLDGIIISGDIVDDGIPDHLSSFKDQFLHDLCSHLDDISNENVLVVPGNHDLEWTDPKNAKLHYRELFNRWDLGGKTITFDYKDKSGNRQTGSIRCLEFKIKTQDSKELQVGIFGLDSCIIDSPDYPGFGFIGKDQLNRLSEISKDCDIRIAILHHHLVPVHECLKIDQERANYSLTIDSEQVLKKLIELEFSAVIHGHQHKSFLAIEERPISLQPAKDRRILIVGGGTFSGGNSPPFSFNLIEIDDTNITISTYKDINNSFSFRRDPSMSYLYPHNRCNSARRRIAESLQKYLNNPRNLKVYSSEFDRALIHFLALLGVIRQEREDLHLNDFTRHGIKPLASNFLKSLGYYLNINDLTVFGGWNDPPDQDEKSPYKCLQIRNFLTDMELKRKDCCENSIKLEMDERNQSY